MIKLILKVEGVKRKQQLTKVHNFSLGFTSNTDKEALKSLGRATIESNMKTSNKAVLMGFRANVNGNGFETVPSIQVEV